MMSMVKVMYMYMSVMVDLVSKAMPTISDGVLTLVVSIEKVTIRGASCLLDSRGNRGRGLHEAAFTWLFAAMCARVGRNK